MDRLKILVVDDEERMRTLVRDFLARRGFSVLEASDGMEAVDICFEQKDIALIIMDVMMPRMDGLSAMLKIRESQNFPIILLSAKSEDTDKITGLSFRADDYVTKPFNPLELVARVNSQIRRYSTLGSMEKTDSQIITGGLVRDTRSKQVTVDGEQVHLTAREYKILEYLMQNMNVVLSSSQIYEAVWNEASFGIEKTVTVHIRNIREKIEINPKEPKYLKVVYGLGYKIEKL